MLGILFALLMWAGNLHAWGTNARNDPFPPYTSVDPQYFLYEREKQLMMGMADEKGTPERLMISLSPFGQNANYAKTLAATYCNVTTPNTCAAQCNNNLLSNPGCRNWVELGDIDGRWNLLGLLAGNVPIGVSPASSPLLSQAAQTLYQKAIGTITTNDISIGNLGGTPQCPLSNVQPGYVSVPLKYRKRGIRWDIEALICGDFGLQFQGGIVEISQVLNPCFINLTPETFTTCSGTMISPTNFNCVLFDNLIPLAKQLGLNLCNFTRWGFEDVYLVLFWRHAHPVNFNRDLSWARCLVIPFARFGGSVATGHIKDPSIQFSLPFGNNGSNSVDANVGINVDFTETVEVGTEVGYSHFFAKDFTNYRLPTNELQSGIYPYATNVNIKPGDTAYVAAKLAAYHFIDRLSFYFQWAYVHHRKDHLELLVQDPAFISYSDNDSFPGSKCRNTVWRVQLGNIGFTYDVSPSIGLGFLWQQMFHVRNAYNSTTAMFTFNMIF